MTRPIIAQIPARGGSKRVPAKNLRYLCGRPLIAYAIENALKSGIFSEVYVNTDSDLIAAFAQTCNAKVYRRPASLGFDTATGDDFTADFLEHVPTDTLAMISPVCPLLTVQSIQSAVRAFGESDCDTLISCESTQMQTFCESRAVNIDTEGPLAPSQQNPVVQILNWAITIWDTRQFMRSYRSKKNGYIGTKRLLFPINAMEGLKISYEADFQAAELLILARQQVEKNNDPPRYWPKWEGTKA